MRDQHRKRWSAIVHDETRYQARDRTSGFEVSSFAETVSSTATLRFLHSDGEESSSMLLEIVVLRILADERQFC
jgi:hypothetical protein